MLHHQEENIRIIWGFILLQVAAPDLHLLTIEQIDTHTGIAAASQSSGVRDTKGTEDPKLGLGTAGFFRPLLWGLFIPIGYWKPVAELKFLSGFERNNVT